MPRLLQKGSLQMSIVSDLRPISAQYNAFAEVWKRLAEVPQTALPQLLKEVEPGALRGLWKASMSRYVLDDDRANELMGDFNEYNDFPATAGELVTYLGVSEIEDMTSKRPPIALVPVHRGSFKHLQPRLEAFVTRPVQRRFFQQVFFRSPTTGLMFARTTMQLVGPVPCWWQASYCAVNTELVLTPSSLDAGADITCDYTTRHGSLDQSSEGGSDESQQEEPDQEMAMLQITGMPVNATHQAGGRPIAFSSKLNTRPQRSARPQRGVMLVQARKLSMLRKKLWREAGPPPDLATRLFSERIMYLGMPIDSSVAELLTAQLFVLVQEAPDPIYFYINSTGIAKSNTKFGNEHEAIAVYNMLRGVQKFCPVYTLAVGNAFGEAALLLSAGSPGKRAALRSATIMLRQPLQRLSGMQASDIDIYRKITREKTHTMAKYLALHTKKSEDDIIADFARPRYFTPYEAAQYGLIDTVLEPKDDKNVAHKDWAKMGSDISELGLWDDEEQPLPTNVMYPGKRGGRAGAYFQAHSCPPMQAPASTGAATSTEFRDSMGLHGSSWDSMAARHGLHAYM
ncbi:hypothetical protein QJQ45_025739 [Haematococcus lacustris]|nr:hypothetical protein QJQ45_025739 [Haematococcus lacustris]